MTVPTVYGAKSTGYRYDLDGNRAKIIYSDGTAVTYSFDNAGRLLSLADWSTRVTSYAYSPDGRTAGMTTINGTNASYTYDNARRLTQITQVRAGVTFLQNRYTLDPVGNRTSVDDLVSQSSGPQSLSWGPNGYEQLGDGTTTPRSGPVPLGASARSAGSRPANTTRSR